MVFLKHEQTGMSLEKAVDELQKDFEVAMETVVTAIRRKHNVTEQQMTQVMVEHQADAEVQLAVQTLREVNLCPTPLQPSAPLRPRTHARPPAAAQAMSGKAPAKQVVPQDAVKRPTRRAKPRQRKG